MKSNGQFGILLLIAFYASCAWANDVNYQDIISGVAKRRAARRSDLFSSNPTLLLSEPFGITRIPVNDPARYVVHRDERIGGTDYHYSKELIFWSDLATGTINSRKFSLMPLQSFITNQVIEFSVKNWSPVALAVDYVADHLYVLDARGKKVYVFDLDGKNRTVILDGYLNNPTDIALDPNEGLMFIADGKRIIQANMDGTNPIDIVNYKKYKIRSVTLDKDNKRIYWSDQRYHRIKSANYDGSKFMIVLKNDNHNIFRLLGPANLAILSGKLYFYDNIWRHIGSVEIDKATGRGNANTFEIIYDFVSVKAMRMVHPSLQKSIANHPCSNNNGGCPKLCLLAGKSKSNSQLNFSCV